MNVSASICSVGMEVSKVRAEQPTASTRELRIYDLLWPCVRFPGFTQVDGSRLQAQWHLTAQAEEFARVQIPDHGPIRSPALVPARRSQATIPMNIVYSLIPSGRPSNLWRQVWQLSLKKRENGSLFSLTFNSGGVFARSHVLTMFRQNMCQGG